MSAKLIEIILMEAIAALMFWLAYAIGIQHKMELIAGYNTRTAERVTDKPGLARLIARLCLLVGLASALMPLATFLWGNSATGLASCIGGYGGFIIALILMVMLQARDYVR